MNRFSTYLSSQNLAKLLLKQADENLAKGNSDKAVRDTIKAMQAFMTSMNNIASLLREPRRKVRLPHERKRRKVVSKTTPTVDQKGIDSSGIKC